MKKTAIFLIVIFLLILGSCPPVLAQSDIQKIKQQIKNELLEVQTDDEIIAELIQSINADGSWPGINYENVFRTNYEHSKHINNLVALSTSFNSSSSSFYKSKDVKSCFIKAIDFWNKHDFIADNWHTNEIANPRKWNTILYLMEDELSEEQTAQLVKMAGRANFNSWGARPGGDQIKIAGIAAELAIFLNDEEILREAVKIMANEIQVSSGNGIKADMAFHHRVDRVTSILSYGTGYAGAFADWAVRLSGTKYNFPKETTELVIDFYLDGICKSMVHGRSKDPGSMNRGISRPGYVSRANADIPRKLSKVSDYRKDELENIIRIRNEEQNPNLRSNKFFWHSEYQTHQRAKYFTSVRMYSDRNHNMEYPHNYESLKMHHYADGSNFISLSGQEYYDIFSVWDWQKIPGTTVVQKETLPSFREIVKWGKTDFVGGVSDGMYGAATFDFDSPHDDLKAHKSWFFFDEEYVCLGAGIKSDVENQVVTTINQCLLNGEVVVKANSKKTTLKKGDHKMEAVSWVFHDNVAYLFPEPNDISFSNKTHTGKWQDISNQAWAKDKTTEQKDLFSLWINHGKQPENESYQYIVRPAISLNEIDSYKKNSEIQILKNTAEIQAVQHLDLQLAQIVFYKAGLIELENGISLSVQKPGIVMIKTSGKEIEQISVADPTRKLGEFKIKISPEFRGSNELVLSLPQGGEAGKSTVIDKNSELTSGPKTEDLGVTKKFEKPREDGQHYVGEKYGGGIIIWLDEKREHGLIAATEDAIASVSWKNGEARIPAHYGDAKDRFVNAGGNGIGAGEINTLLVVSQQTDDHFYGNFAAKAAIEFTHRGYGDWYLPSKAELNIMYELKDEIGGFDNNLYWSSTEYNVGFAWGLSFKGYKSEYTFNKGARCAVRCVRKF